MLISSSRDRQNGTPTLAVILTLHVNSRKSEDYGECMSPVRRTKRINEFLTAAEAAAALGISVATLWRWRGRKVLTGHELLGRTVFERVQVEAVRKRRAVAAG